MQSEQVLLNGLLYLFSCIRWVVGHGARFITSEVVLVSPAVTVITRSGLPVRVKATGISEPGLILPESSVWSEFSCQAAVGFRENLPSPLSVMSTEIGELSGYSRSCTCTEKSVASAAPRDGIK